MNKVKRSNSIKQSRRGVKGKKQRDLKRSRYMCRRVGRLGVKEGEGERMIEKEGVKWEMEIYRKG